MFKVIVYLICLGAIIAILWALNTTGFSMGPLAMTLLFFGIFMAGMLVTSLYDRHRNKKIQEEAERIKEAREEEIRKEGRPDTHRSVAQQHDSLKKGWDSGRKNKR